LCGNLPITQILAARVLVFREYRSDREEDSVTETFDQLDEPVEIDRRMRDRREPDSERRVEAVAVAVDQRQGARRKAQRRRQIDPTTCEREYTSDEIEFMQGLDAYKRTSGRMFPTCSEILEVVRSLGYVKLSETGEPVPAEISGSSHYAEVSDDSEGE
jgi:hypothetical protein